MPTPSILSLIPFFSLKLSIVKVLRSISRAPIPPFINIQLFHLLSLASVAVALPFSQDANTKRQASCNSQEWNIQQYTAFTAGTTSPTGGPPVFGYSHISFKFADPNFNIQYECSAEAETGQSLDSLVGNSYPCDGGNMSLQYFGSSIELQRTGVACGK